MDRGNKKRNISLSGGGLNEIKGKPISRVSG